MNHIDNKQHQQHNATLFWQTLHVLNKKTISIYVTSRLFFRSKVYIVIEELYDALSDTEPDGDRNKAEVVFTAVDDYCNI